MSSRKAKLITADGCWRFLVVQSPPPTTLRFFIANGIREIRAWSALEFEAESVTVKTRTYQYHGRDQDGAFVYKEVVE